MVVRSENKAPSASRLLQHACNETIHTVGHGPHHGPAPGLINAELPLVLLRSTRQARYPVRTERGPMRPMTLQSRAPGGPGASLSRCPASCPIVPFCAACRRQELRPGLEGEGQSLEGANQGGIGSHGLTVTMRYLVRAPKTTSAIAHKLVVIDWR